MLSLALEQRNEVIRDQVQERGRHIVGRAELGRDAAEVRLLLCRRVLDISHDQNVSLPAFWRRLWTADELTADCDHEEVGIVAHIPLCDE